MALRPPRVIRRVLALFRWRSRDREMEREMAFHIDSLARDYARDGLSNVDAQTQHPDDRWRELVPGGASPTPRRSRSPGLAILTLEAAIAGAARIPAARLRRRAIRPAEKSR